MQFTSEIKGMNEVKANLDRVPKRAYKPMKKSFQDFAFKLQKIMVRSVSNNQLKRRSGNLARGFIPKVGGTNVKKLFAEVANDVKYAAIHQFGGVIKATKSKFLTIPLKANLTPSGVMRKSARRLISEGNTFTRKSKKGNLIIFENRGKDRKPVPMFALKTNVKIKKRLKFLEAGEALAKRVIKDMQRFIFNG